ncbi:MAG: hypothetical protein PVF27_10565 [Gemmatimonadales bacterium]
MNDAVARANKLGADGDGLRRALHAIETRRRPRDERSKYDWLPCYVELVRYRRRDHWAIEVAWGDATGELREYPAARMLDLCHRAEYLVTATGRTRIVGEHSCE